METEDILAWARARKDKIEWSGHKVKATGNQSC